MHRPTLHPSSVSRPALNRSRSHGRRFTVPVAAWMVAAAALAVGTACTPEAIDLTLNATLDDVQIDRDDSAPAGDQSVGDVRQDNPRGGGITDGSSNTIQLDERDVPAKDDGVRPAPPSDGASDDVPVEDVDSSGGSADDASASDAPPSSGAAADAELVRVLTESFGNRLFEFGRSSGNSDNNAFVTGTNELTLCASGRFFLREQFSFSGDVNFIPEPDDSIGAWVIVVRDDGVPAVELRIEQTTATSQAPVLQFALSQDDAGNLFLNGARAFNIEDATSACQ